MSKEAIEVAASRIGVDLPTRLVVLTPALGPPQLGTTFEVLYSATQSVDAGVKAGGAVTTCKRSGRCAASILTIRFLDWIASHAEGSLHDQASIPETGAAPSK